MSRINIIGSGISGLSAACFAAKKGHEVHVFEKNATIGGRTRQYTEQGFMFDMGPSWYWMPDIFERFYQNFGHTTSDFYNLVKLDPGFRIYFGAGDLIDVPADPAQLEQVFEQTEPGSAVKLRKFLSDAEFKYREGMLNLAFKPGNSWMEFATPTILKAALKMNLFTPMSRHVRQYFKNPRLITLMEFPVIFLGAMPDRIPALYSMMNHAALTQGTFYPMGGMFGIIDSMHKIAVENGVEFHTSSEVRQICTTGGKARGVDTDRGMYLSDTVIASGDYHHTESKLLVPEHRNYTVQSWDKRVFAPGCLIFYVGINKLLPELQHHNLFFDTDFDRHSREIYERPAWPGAPLFYVCCPSRTDTSVAPEGHENLFVLMPIATGLPDDPDTIAFYYDLLISRIERVAGVTIRDHVVYKKSYCTRDFINDYHAFRGNAYGLANTLMQTAVLKPSMTNKKIPNLFYAGQLTVPGPGLPPGLISGEIAAALAEKQLN